MTATEHISGVSVSSRTAGSWSARAQNLATKGRLPIPVLIYLLTVTLPLSFSLGPLHMTTLRLFLIVMIIPLIIQLLMGKYGKVIITDVLFILHILWAGIAIQANTPDQMVTQVGSVGVEFLGGYVMGRAYIRTPAAFAALCRALIVIVLCTAPFALFETLTGRPLILEALRKLPALSTVANVNSPARMGLERVQASFAHPIHYGLFCSVAFSLSLVALKGLVGDTQRFVTSFIVATAGFLALSSGALTAFAMQFGLIAWATIFKGFKRRWWLLVGLMLLAYIMIDLLSNRSPLQVFMSYATFSSHNAYWRSIIFDWGLANVIGSVEKGIVGSPLFGLGMGDWIRPSYMYSGSMDNFWLVMAVRYGLPGFLLLALGYIIVIVRVMRRNFEGDERLTLFRRAWVFTFLGLTFTLCTVHVWTNIYSFVFFMFGAGVWLITAQLGAKEATTNTMASPATLGNKIRYSRFPTRSGATQSSSVSN